MAVSTKPKTSERSEALSNPFRLPRGERLRRECVAVFRQQREAILGFLKTGKKDQVPDPLTLPFHWPVWHDFGLGALEVSKRMTPILKVTWDNAASAFAPKVGLDPDEWSVVNPHTERMIDEAALAFCDSMNQTTSLALDDALLFTRSTLIEGIVEQGENLQQLTKRINAIFTSAEKHRARRIAQTETSRAVHAAQEQAAIESGVVTGWQWLASADACPKCIAVYRRAPAVKLGHAFAVVGDNPHYSQVKFPPLHPHCCLPETPVIAPGLFAGLRARYDGSVVRIRCSDGSDVTVTPNHMLLTPTGFAPASALVHGDDVLRYEGIDRSLPGSPDDDWKPSLIEQVVRSLAISAGGVTARVPVSTEDLHGDAAFCDGDVHVVTTDRLLRNRHDPRCAESFIEGILQRSDVGNAVLSGDGNVATVLFALRDATDSGMSGIRERQALIWGHLRESQRSRVGAIPWLDAGPQQSSSDRGAGETHRERDCQFGFTGLVSPEQLLVIDPSLLTEQASDVLPSFEGDASLDESMPETVSGQADRLRDCLHRLSGKVATCKIVDIEILHYVGSVYDVQTESSLYLIGNGIASSNCNCTMLEVLDTDPQPAWHDTLHQPDPATPEEHDEVADRIRETIESIFPSRGKPEKPKPKPRQPAKPRPPRAALPKPAPPKPEWEWGTPVAPGQPIGERIKLSPAAQRVKELAKIGSAEDAQKLVRKLEKDLQKLNADIGRRFMEGTITESDRQAALTRIASLNAELKAAQSARRAISAKAAFQAHDLLKVPPGVKRFDWSHDVALDSPQSKEAFGHSDKFLDRLMAEGKSGQQFAAIRWETLKAYEEQRPYAHKDTGRIYLSIQETGANAVHEWGHHIEYRIPGAQQAATEFLAHRVGNEPLRPMRELAKDKAYKADEMGREDDFRKTFGDTAGYIGKHYDHGSTEIISMGIEKLYSDPGHFAKHDPEYCTFIVGILDGSLRSP